jgi:hypothetical protein
MSVSSSVFSSRFKFGLLPGLVLVLLSGFGGGGNVSRDWQSPRLIESDNAGDAFTPEIAIDGSGNGLAVWGQSDGTRFNIWANRFTPGSGWGTAELIETENAGDAISPQIATDGSGNALAVWYQSDGTRLNIWANRFTPGSGWGTAELIETDNTRDAYVPEIAIDGSGNALAVFQLFDGTRMNIWANRYTPGSGWGTAELIETDNAGSAASPQIAINGSGNALTVWHQYDGALFNIWANRYTPGSGWGTAELIERLNTNDASGPQIAIDGSGNALAVWHQSGVVARYNIWARRYTPGSGWGTAELIETDHAGGAVNPQIAIDGSGNALAVWTQYDGTRNNIVANRYTPGSGWGAAELIETDAGSASSFSQIATDGSGNAIAVWEQHDGTRFNIWANRYTPGSGWGTAELIETNETGDASDPQIAIDGSGNALAVWHQFGRTRFNIWANRYE